MEATKYRPLSDVELAQIPVKGGARSKAFISQQEMRAVLLPPDED